MHLAGHTAFADLSGKYDNVEFLPDLTPLTISTSG